MLYVHIFVAALIYYFASALWFSPLLAGKLWTRLMNWDVNEIKNIKMSKIELFFMYFSAFFAGIAMAGMQAFLLTHVFKELNFLAYILMIAIFLFAFLCLPALPNYLFKSYKLGISVKQAACLWIVEMKATGLGTLLQAVYLFFGLK